MSVTFAAIRVGEPIRHETLSVFPLFTEPGSKVDYLLSDEAIAAEAVIVKEVSESGSVPDLLVENKGDARVLFLEGEELVGAKQNRILNTSVLVAAHSSTKIPVSCVEHGRWRFRSKHFASGGTHSSSKLLYCLKASVSRSVQAGGSHTSDQGAIWREVARQQESLGASSGTGAMSDTYEAHRQRLDEFREKVRYIEGASGVVVAVGGKVVALDVFDKPTTCRKVWDRLMSGFVMDALEVGETEHQVEISDVARLLDGLGHFNWQPAQTVGEGEEYRAETPTGDHASALSFDGAVLHGSVVCQ